jgi:hypothetical protein
MTNRPPTLLESSNIDKLDNILDQIADLTTEARKFDVACMPKNIQRKMADLDIWEQANEAEVLKSNALNSWRTKWKDAYTSQFPQHIITPIHRGLTPLESIILGLLAANIRTIPMMMEVLTERTRHSFMRALKNLVSKGFIFKVSASMYFESSYSRKDAKKLAKDYIASNRNPNGVVPMARSFGFDDVATSFTRIMRKNNSWKKVGKHPDEHEDYKTPSKYKKSAIDRLH